jgi:hypothetical protein
VEEDVAWLEVVVDDNLLLFVEILETAAVAVTVSPARVRKHPQQSIT